MRSILRVETKSSSKSEAADDGQRDGAKADPAAAKPWALPPGGSVPAKPPPPHPPAAAPGTLAAALPGQPGGGRSGRGRSGRGGSGRAGQAGAPTGGKRKARRRQHPIATANELVYDDAERRARYTGTARMVGDQGDLRGERLELYFDESGRGLSRLEGFDAVRFALKARPGGGPRWGNGGRITYFADDERYVLSGPRATVVERLDPQQCRETTGRTLTFCTSTDRLS